MFTRLLYLIFSLVLCCAVHLCIIKTDPKDMQRITENTRKLGLVVIRGTQVSLVSPKDGMEEIANPFLAQDDED